MGRCPAAAALLALLAATALLTPGMAAASLLPSQAQPLRIDVSSDAEAALFQQVVGALTVLSQATNENRPVPDDLVVAAAAPPGNFSATQVSSMFVRVLAAASMESEVASSLGNPNSYP